MNISKETQTTEQTTVGLFDALQQDPEVQEYLELADTHMAVIGYTEHGSRHARRVALGAGMILERLEYPSEDVELARVAGYLHDIGNFICRTNHGQTSVALVFPILKRHGVTNRQAALVLSAIGNHEEEYGQVYNNICAAVMLGDKADVHRSRVRHYDPSRGDIHDDVNYAVTSSALVVDGKLHRIRLVLEIDSSIATVMDYFEIFMSRMVMCRSAARFLGCSFHIICNGTELS